MIGSWIVEAAIRFGGNGIQYMERLGVATRATAIRQAELTGKITAQEAAYLRLQNRMKAVDSQWLSTIGRISGGVAIAGALGIGDAFTQASQLQRTLIAIKNETGASADQMERFYQTIFKIANIQGVSPVTAGQVMLDISRLTAGTMSPSQMQAIAPMVAGFASTLNFNRPNVSVDEATQYGLQIAHLFRAYRTNALKPLLDEGYRLSGLIGEQPAQALRQMSYYAPMFKGLGIDNETTFAMMALLDRAGFRNKVGTNVRAMVLQELGPLQLTKHYQQGQGRILEQMGIFRNGRFAWNTRTGGVDFLGELSAIAQWATRLEREGVPKSTIFRDIYGALGKQGGTIGTLMSDQQVVGILAGIRNYLRDQHVSLATGELNRQGSVAYQAGRVWGNLQADLTELGYRATWAGGTLKNVADTLHNWQVWMHQHRKAEDWIGGIAAGTTALAGIGATASISAKLLKFFSGGLVDVEKLATPAGDALGNLASKLGLFAKGIGLIDGALVGGIVYNIYKDLTEKHPNIKKPVPVPRSDLLPFGLNLPPIFGSPALPPATPSSHRQHTSERAAHVHVGKIEMHFPNVHDAHGVEEAVRHAVNHPLHTIFSNTPSRHTHPNIPRALSTQPL